MLFNSPIFVVFFGCVFCLYWWLRRREPQNVLLLIASYVFYGTWSWKFLALLWLSTLMDYTCGRLIGATSERGRRRFLLVLSVAFNLTLLGTFKYAGFFVTQAAALLDSLGFHAQVRTLDVVLPIGISFYTFQSLSYVIDVYRSKLKPIRNLFDYALYVAFFPQLVAGPIERATHLLPQFMRERVWSRPAFESGLQLIIWGLFKKMVIADNLAPYVNAVYGEPRLFSGSALLTATIFFAFQIYLDFSGYSDAARGIARTLGFELILNFEQPYFSKTPVEFWRRWHISLSQWFQDYLYFPLAMHYMRKGGWGSKYKAHIIAMGLIGLWHGANWTFVFFGLYWGVVLASYLYLTERLGRLPADSAVLRAMTAPATRPIYNILATVSMFVVACLGWVLFRAESIGEAWFVVSHFFSTSGLSDVVRAEVPSSAILWTMVVGLWLAEWVYRNRPTVIAVLMGGERRQLLWRHAMLVAMLFSYVVAQEGKVQPFIYFRF